MSNLDIEIHNHKEVEEKVRRRRRRNKNNIFKNHMRKGEVIDYQSNNNNTYGNGKTNKKTSKDEQKLKGSFYSKICRT